MCGLIHNFVTADMKSEKKNLMKLLLLIVKENQDKCRLTSLIQQSSIQESIAKEQGDVVGSYHTQQLIK